MSRGGKIVLLVLFALFAGFFPFLDVLLDSSRYLLTRDLSLSFGPGKYYWLESVKNFGIVPRWNYHSLAGVSFYAECNIGPLYPLNLILLFFSRENFYYGMSWFLAAHYSLAFLGFFALSRALRLHFYAALLLSLAFSWSAVLTSSSNLIHILAGQVASVWFLFFWYRFLKTSNCLYVFGASYALAWPIYGGDPQYTYILAILAVPLYFLFSKKEGTKFWVAYGSLGVLSILASAAQLLPTLEFVRGSGRSLEGLTAEGSALWSLHPVRLWDMLYPQFAGYVFPNATVWTHKYINSPAQVPFIYNLYLGALPCFLLLWRLFFLRPKCSLTRVIRKMPWGYLALFTVLLLLTLGAWSPLPLHKIFFTYMPGWSLFRYPERLIFFPILLLFLASIRSFRLLLRVHFFKKIPKKVFLLVIFLALITALNRWLYPEVTWDSLLRGFLSQSICALAVLALAKGKQKALFLGLLLLTLVDARLSNQWILWNYSKSFVEADTYVATKKVQEDMYKRKEENEKGAAFRFFSVNQSSLSWTFDSERAKILGLMPLRMLNAWESLSGNTSIFFDIYDVTGYYSLVPSLKVNYWELMRDRQSPKLVDLMSVRYLMFREADKIPEIRINEDALPYISNFSQCTYAEDEKAALKTILQDSFPFRETLLLESNKDSTPNCALPSAKQKMKFKVLTKTPDQMRFHIENAGQEAQWVLLNESYDRNWTLKGPHSMPLYRANSWAMGFLAPPGTYEIQLKYEDPSILKGQILSLSWLIGLLGLLFIRFRKRPKLSLFAPN